MSSFLEVTAALTALSVTIQSLELIVVRKNFSETGVWRWSLLQREFLSLRTPIRSLLNICFSERGFTALCLIRLLSAPILGAAPSFSLALLHLFLALLTCIRFRGTYNGGSDFMTIVLLSGLSVSLFAPTSPAFHAGGLLWIALQSVSSYFTAGVAKLRSREWRNGSALRIFLRDSVYGEPKWLTTLPGQGVLAWSILAIELLFPAMLVSSEVAYVLLPLGALFHFANASLFGLNRFLLAWVATYPSLLFANMLFGS